MFTNIIHVLSLGPIERSRWGIITAPNVREQRSKKKNECDKRKRKRTHPKGSTPSLPPHRRALVTIEEGLDLSLVPFAMVVTLKGAQFQPLEVFPRASRSAHDQSLFISSTTALVGEENQELESSPVAGTKTQMVEMTSGLSVDEKI